MKKAILLPIVSLLTISLSSCFIYDPTPAYQYFVNEDDDFRYVKIRQKDTYYVVDEYHYREVIYNEDGEVYVDIDIPRGYNSQAVNYIGGQYEINEGLEGQHKIRHNQPDMSWTLIFCVLAYDYFPEGSTIYMDFYIPKYVKRIELSEVDGSPGRMIMYWNGGMDGEYMEYNLKLNFEVEEGNNSYYSDDGKLYTAKGSELVFEDTIEMYSNHWWYTGYPYNQSTYWESSTSSSIE